MNVVAGADLADDEVIEESLFEHVSKGKLRTSRVHYVHSGIAIYNREGGKEHSTTLFSLGSCHVFAHFNPSWSNGQPDRISQL